MSRKRLNLDLTPEAYELLQKLSDESGKTMAEVLRTGLALYGIARDEQTNGRELGVVQGDKVIKEILIPKWVHLAQNITQSRHYCESYKLLISWDKFSTTLRWDIEIMGRDRNYNVKQGMWAKHYHCWGVRLSGSQCQRLGIARALLVNPDILVFNEATSSLDYESERLIQLAMRRIQGARTTIVIAHRFSAVREADKIVVLDKGEIVEIDSHQQLLAQGGIYHRLYALQETGDLL